MRKMIWAIFALLVVIGLVGWRAFQSEPLEQGTVAPDFTLQDQNGKEHKLSDYRGRYVVLMFYPKDFTSGCTAQNCSVRDAYDQIKELEVVVFGISTDSVETHAKFAQEHNLKHTLLADVGGSVAKQYGVYNSIGFANRVTYVVSPKGTITKVFPKAATANHAQELLEFLNQETKSASVETGRKMPDFTLPDVTTGNDFRLYDVSGKKLIVLVWVATRCPIATAHNERLNAIVKEYAPRGVQFIGINSNVTEPVDEVKVHAKQSGYQFPVLKDEGNKIADLYEANVTPEVFVMDDNFVLRYHGRIDDGVQQGIETGKITKQELRDALAALLSGKQVAQAEVRALGCSIKRAKKPRG